MATPYLVTLLCTHGMSLLSMALCLETLRITNRAAGVPLFQWQLVTESGSDVITSGGLPVTPDADLKSAKPTQLVLVLASYGVERTSGSAVLAWIRSLHYRGVTLGCVDSGGVVLARAGILGEHRLAMHHETASYFLEHWPANCDPDSAFLIDGPFASCGGGVDTIDMMLQLVATIAGVEVADKAATILRYERHTSSSDFDWTIGRLGTITINPDLRTAIECMNNHIESPLTLPDIERVTGLSPARLRRIFGKFLHTTPGQYYLGLRLDRASRLLKFSDMKLMEISAACGFSDSAAFSNSYRKHFGISPSSARTEHLKTWETATSL